MMLESFVATALLSTLGSQPHLVYLVVGFGVAVIVIALFILRFVWNAPLPDRPIKEKALRPVKASPRKWYVIGLTTSFTATTLLLLHRSSSKRIASTHRHLTGDSLVSSSVVNYLDGLRTDWGIPGVSIAIVRQGDDNVWKQQTIGLGRKDAKGNQVTDRTLFSLASNSKLFTSIASGLALTRANLTWGTPVQSVFPEFQLMDKQAEKDTTFIELLSHQTGLPRHDLSYDANITDFQLLSSVRYLKPSAPFKSHWQYNNIAYAIASHVPQQLLGTSFDSFVQNSIWTPLGMHRTYYDHVVANHTGDLSSGFVRRLASGQSGFNHIEACLHDIKRSERLSERCRGQELDLGWYQKDWRPFAGAGGVITCSKDMTLWLRTLLLHGLNPTTGDPVIPSTIIDATITPRMASRPNATDPETTLPHYGLAQSMYDYRGHRVIEHGGDVPGQKSQIIRLPDKMIGVAIMVNDEQLGGLYHEVAKWRIIDHLLGLTPVDFKTRKLGKMLEASFPKPRVARPDHPRPPSDGFDSIPGIYTHPAYGSIDIRPARHYERLEAQHEPLSCHRDPPAPCFIADINKVWALQLLFTHFDGDAFNVTAKYLAPDTKAMLWDNNGSGSLARFGEGGAGLERIWGAGEGVPNGDMERYGIRDGSEVFFLKL